MIRIRRTATRIRLARRYELELQLSTEPKSEWSRLTMGRGGIVRRLEPILGVGDAWSFVTAADEAWGRGDIGWAVEFEERGK